MLALAAALIVAAQPNSWLDDARALTAKLEFSQAIERLQVARQVPGLTPPEMHAVLELLAYCQVAEGRRDEAEATFVELLELDASAELSKDVASPKVSEAFEAVRAKHFPPDYVRLTEQQAAAGRVAFLLADPWKRVARVVLNERRDGAPVVERLLDGTRGRFAFPLVVAVGSELSWWVEARDAAGDVVVSLGSAAAPRVVKVPRIESSATMVSAPATGVSAARVAGIAVLVAGVLSAALAAGLSIGGWNLRTAARDASKPPGDFAATALAAERDGRVQQTWGVGLFIGAGVALGTGLVLVW